MITSSSTRDYTVTLPDGSTETRTYQWRQTITYHSCQHGESPRDMKPTQMLRVDQVFVMYDANDIIRFAMTNKIGDVNGEVIGIIFCLPVWSARTSFLEYNILTPDCITRFLDLLHRNSFFGYEIDEQVFF